MKKFEDHTIAELKELILGKQPEQPVPDKFAPPKEIHEFIMRPSTPKADDSPRPSSEKVSRILEEFMKEREVLINVRKSLQAVKESMISANGDQAEKEMMEKYSTQWTKTDKLGITLFYSIMGMGRNDLRDFIYKTIRKMYVGA